MGSRSTDSAGRDTVSPFLSVRIQEDCEEDEDAFVGLQGANYTQGPSSGAGRLFACIEAWDGHFMFSQLCSAGSHTASADTRPDAASASCTLCIRMSAGHRRNARLSHAPGVAAGSRAQTMQPQQAQYQWGEPSFLLQCALLLSPGLGLVCMPTETVVPS